MSTVVIMPGGFHPFHAGHFALYQSAKKAFPDAEVFVAATNDQSERPFPFQLKEKLAKLAGVEYGHFVQVKSPFQAKEITQHFNPEQDVLIFVRSEKDRNESPKPGGTKKDGTPAYFQPWTGKDVQPFAKHAYFAYLPTVEFGPGITSATQIRKAWPTLNDKRKLALVMSLYPAAQKNLKLAQTVASMFDQVMGGSVTEGDVIPFRRPQATPLTWEQLPKDVLKLANDWYWASEDDSGLDAVLDPKGFGSGTRNELQYITAKLQQRGWYIDFNDEHDKPGEFNLILKNKNGQSLLLPIEDAQDFKGWAQGTDSDLNEDRNPLVDLTPNFPNYASLVGEYVGLQGNKIALRIVAAELKPGAKPTEKIAKAIAANRPIAMAPNYVRNRAVIGEEDEPYEYRPPGASSAQTRNVMSKINPTNNKFVWKKPNQIGGSYSEQELLAQGFKKSQYNSWGGTPAMWNRLMGIKEARIMFTDPNSRVNVYYNSKNPKYAGKPVQVGKQIPYNKLDAFINMIVSKYNVKPTEFVWRDIRGDNTLAHTIHEDDDYLEEK